MRVSSYDGRFFLLRAFGFPLVKVGVRSRSFRENASVFSLFPFLLMRSFQFALVSLVMSYIFNVLILRQSCGLFYFRGSQLVL